MIWRNAEVQTAARVINLSSGLSMGVCTHTHKDMHDQ